MDGDKDDCSNHEDIPESETIPEDILTTSVMKSNEDKIKNEDENTNFEELDSDKTQDENPCKSDVEQTVIQGEVIGKEDNPQGLEPAECHTAQISFVSETSKESQILNKKTDEPVMMEYRGNVTEDRGKGDGCHDSSDSSPDSSTDNSDAESIDDQEHEATDTKLNKILTYDRDASPDRKVKLNKQGLEDIRTRGELSVEDLPPVEELKISVNVNTEMVLVGKISSIVGCLVVIEQTNTIPPLDVDTLLFLEGHKFVGQIFEVLGPVVKPWYTVRFNTQTEIDGKGLQKDMQVFYAPKEDDFTKYVLVSQVRQVKGSDASWKDNNETPEKYQDFSDDESEKRAKAKRKGKKLEEDENEDSQPGKNKDRDGPGKKPYLTQWPPRDPPPRTGYKQHSRHPFQGPRQRSQHPQMQPRHSTPWSNQQEPRWRQDQQFGGPPQFNQRPRFNNRIPNFSSPPPTNTANIKTSPGFINNSAQFGNVASGQGVGGQFGQGENVPFCQFGNMPPMFNNMASPVHQNMNEPNKNMIAQQEVENFFQSGQFTRPPPNFSLPPNKQMQPPQPPNQPPRFFINTNVPPPQMKVNNDNGLGNMKFGKQSQIGYGQNNVFSQGQINPPPINNANTFGGNQSTIKAQSNTQTGNRPNLILDTRFIQKTD